MGAAGERRVTEAVPATLPLVTASFSPGLIAPLGLIREAQLQLRKFRRWFHRGSFRWSTNRGAYVPYRAGGCHVCRLAIREGSEGDRSPGRLNSALE